jgi:hypothetical protein
MRKLILFLASFVIFAAIAPAASAPTYTEARQYLYAVGCNTTTDQTTGAVTAVSWQGVYYGHFVNTTDPTDTFERQDGSVNWSGITTAKSVTVSGTTLNYAQIFAFNQAMADQEWKALQASAAAKAAAAKPGP